MPMQSEAQSTPKKRSTGRRYHLSHVCGLLLVLALFLAACSALPSTTEQSGNGNTNVNGNANGNGSGNGSSTPQLSVPTPTPTPLPPTNDLSVYVGSQPEPGSTGSIVYALQAANGTMRWQYQTSVISLSLAENNGVVYAVGSDVHGAGGIVYALRSTDGVVLWKQVVTGYGLLAPQIVNGVLYTASLLDGSVYALNTNDGSVLWHAKTTHTNNGVNFLLVSGGYIYVTGITDGTVYALRTSDGSLQWKYATGQQALTPPQTDGTNVYVLAISSAQAPGTLLALQGTSGKLRWSYKQGSNFISQPVLSGGNVYVDVSNGNVYALRGADGSVLWHSVLGSAGSWSSPTIASGVLYVANTTDKVLYALHLSNGSSLWHAAIDADNVAVSMTIDVTSNVVYVFAGGGAGGSLVAMRSSDGSPLWHADGNPLALLTNNTAQVANGNVYYTDTQSGVAYSLNGNDGTELWQYSVGTPSTGESDPLVLGQ